MFASALVCCGSKGQRRVVDVGNELTEPVAKLFAERLHVVYACRAKVEHRVIVGCCVLNVEQGGADGQRLGVVA